jgi:hypothetical protein
MHYHLGEASRRLRRGATEPHRFYDRLMAALAAGESISVRKLVDELTADEARVREYVEIAKRPREQLWNSVFSERPSVIDAVVIARLSAAARAHNADPAVRAAKSISTSDAWKDPEARARRSAAISAAKSDPGQTLLASAQSKARWSDPQFRSRRAAAARELWSDPDYAAKMGARRAVAGETHYKATLDDQQVSEIRKLAALRVLSLREIGRLFGVRDSTISRIVTGKRRANSLR